MHGQPDYASTAAPATGVTGTSPSSTGKAKTRMDATARWRGFKAYYSSKSNDGIGF
jgi:hypothetical protein